jgi:peptide/nickel transport system permease protein
MRRYLLRRVLFVVPLLWGITLITFIMMRVLPPNPVYLLAGPQADAETVAAITREFGLDRPILVQYARYMRDLVRGDLGRSFRTGNAVTDDLRTRFPATFELVTVAFAVAAIAGIGLGLSAAFRGGWRDRVATAMGTLGVAAPSFWIALILIYIFFYLLRWLPGPEGRLDLGMTPPEAMTGLYVVDSVLAGDFAALRSAVLHLVLPVVTLALFVIAPLVNVTRASASEVLSSDYIWYARAMGLPPRMLRAYTLRNALLPVVTVLGVLYSRLLGGAVLTETIFAWNGVSQYAIESLYRTDFNAVQGFTLLMAVISVGVYFAVDVAYLALDPRIVYA